MKYLRLLFVSALIVLVWVLSCNKEKPAVEERRRETRAYLDAAIYGNVEAQYEIGRRFWTGHGAELNDEKAVKWFKMAAAQGHADAQYCLGEAYSRGYGVEENNEKAREWFLKAADQYRKAAEGGDMNAQFKLGEMYSRGLVGDKNGDEEEAIKWYKKAAEQGHEYAQDAVEWYKKQQNKDKR